MKTYMAKPEKDQAERWYTIDATDKVLGRLATRIATILMGKHRPEYTPHVDTGDHVVVIHARKIKINGANKPKQKTYKTYSGYTGGLKEVNLERMLEKKPEEVIKEAVRRMLPKNLLAKKVFKKLRVYADGDHRHQAQKPEKLEV